jgi:stage II sporulation protein P
LYAQKLHEQLNAIVPSISRGILKKGEEGANGIYNQDLARNIVLIELGGIDNTEEELMRTIAVLARAIANMKQNEQL